MAKNKTQPKSYVAKKTVITISHIIPTGKVITEDVYNSLPDFFKSRFEEIIAAPDTSQDNTVQDNITAEGSSN